MNVEYPITKYSIRDSLVESVESVRNKVRKGRYKKQYLDGILGRSLFLGSIRTRRESYKGEYDRYTTTSEVVNRTDEITIISSIMRDITNWLGSGMKLPNVSGRLEEMINEEIREMGASKLCELKPNDSNRIYFLLLNILKPHCDNGKLNSMYERIGKNLMDTLDNEEFVERVGEFKKEYEGEADGIQKERLCAKFLQEEESRIAQKFGRKTEGWL